MTENSVSHDQLANAIRFLSVDAVQAANSGHPGMPMGMADVATVLYTKYMKFDAANPEWADRDRFVLSAGHGSMLIYSLLHLNGSPGMDMDQIRNFRQMGYKTAGHPEYGHAPGIETTTGPLGAGITTSVGMALAERLMNAKYGDDLVDHYTYVVAGDGCLMEGVSQEAISLAGHWGLSKLIVFWDDNEITIDGKTSLSTSENMKMRFEACGWDVQAIDGHNPDQIAAAIEAAKKSDKPSLIACKTTIGFGAPTLAGSHKTHGAPLGAEEIQGMREALGWQAGPFEVPADVAAAWLAAGSRGAADREAWEGRLNGSANKAEFVRAMAGELPVDFTEKMAAYKASVVADQPKLATRVSSKNALAAATAAVPELVGGSADLTGSVGTQPGNLAAISKDNFDGRYVNYGIREHGMGHIMNGMALHGGVIPYAGTFFVFSDYCRPAIRLAALMGIRSIFVLTHDSIGLGEDGPTHQPVEHLASLRAMPNCNVYRPADAVEVAECWELAIEDADTPTCMVLTRQGLPNVRTDASVNMSAKGGYEIRSSKGSKPEVTLMASGSELEIALEAWETLESEGIPTRVVSMPSWERFEEQTEEYKRSVLAPATVRVAIEAAAMMGWERYVSDPDAVVGMTSFGASAPAGELYKHFGITAENVVAKVKERLEPSR